MDDQEFAVLIAQVKTGDREALTRLFREIYPILIRVATMMSTLSRCPNDCAQDNTQDTALAIIQSIDGFRGDTIVTFRAWVAMIQRRAFWNHIKKCRRSRQASDALAEAQVAGYEPEDRHRWLDELIRAEDTKDKIRQALRQLPKELREVVEAIYLEGVTHAEFARRAGIAEATSRQRLCQAISRIRDSTEDATCVPAST